MGASIASSEAQRTSNRYISIPAKVVQQQPQLSQMLTAAAAANAPKSHEGEHKWIGQQVRGGTAGEVEGEGDRDRDRSLVAEATVNFVPRWRKRHRKRHSVWYDYNNYSENSTVMEWSNPCGGMYHPVGKRARKPNKRQQMRVSIPNPIDLLYWSFLGIHYN